MSEEQALIPIEQQAITFCGKPIVVVRLPDGRPGVVLRWICDNLQILSCGQVQRIKRTEELADGLVYVQVETNGGPQIMPTLVLHAVPYWLATINVRRLKKDDSKRLEILDYQRRVVDLLYEWAHYDDLKTALGGHTYSDISGSEWEKVINWFKAQIERGWGAA